LAGAECFEKSRAKRQNAVSRGEFAKQICALIACNQGLVQSPSVKYPLQSVWIRVIIKQRKAVEKWQITIKSLMI